MINITCLNSYNHINENIGITESIGDSDEHKSSLNGVVPQIPEMMIPQSRIRTLVSKVLAIRQLTPDLEQAINSELTRLGYLPDGDVEVLELLMEALDSGRVRLVPSY